MTTTVLASRYFFGFGKRDRIPTYVEFTCKIERIGNEDPYFSITYTYKENGVFCSCGAGGHEYHSMLNLQDRGIVLAMRKWHLTSVNRGPMHYIPNALYWAGCQGYCDGRSGSPPNWNHFLSTIAWEGSDWDANMRNVALLRLVYIFRRKGFIVSILNKRFPSLMNNFYRDMNMLFGEGTITRKNGE